MRDLILTKSVVKDKEVALGQARCMNRSASRRKSGEFRFCGIGQHSFSVASEQFIVVGDAGCPIMTSVRSRLRVA